MQVFAVAVDFEDPLIKYRMVANAAGFEVHRQVGQRDPTNVEHFRITEHTDEASTYLAAMTEWSKRVGDMTASIRPPGRKPSTFSLSMYTEQPEDFGGSVYVCGGVDVTEAAAALARLVDDEGVWDVDELLDMGLPASILALGGNPDGVTKVWVELIIE